MSKEQQDVAETKALIEAYNQGFMSTPGLDESDLLHDEPSLQDDPAPTAEDVNKQIEQKKDKGKGLSGTSPMMTKEEGKIARAASKAAAPVINIEADSALLVAEDIVEKWVAREGRGLTRDQKDCLITAIVSGANILCSDFDNIILGHTIRGDHNIIENRNVLNAMQEVLNSLLATLKEFSKSSQRLIDGMHSAAVRMQSVAPQPSIQQALTSGIKAPTAGVIVPKQTPKATEGKVDPGPSASRVNEMIVKKKTSITITDVLSQFIQYTGRSARYLQTITGDENVSKAVEAFVSVNSIPASDSLSAKQEYWTLFTTTYGK
ncbi:hypothetical protein [Vitis varicosavirus]|uniref:Uncharacterized protein n=1 Tax=Vitis varicosavirus TaxID=2812030 RepID=A0A830R9M6_9RHAB|nr:hypothetical protein QK885_sRNA2gp2 [Vitis varicosavirus]BCS90310.1 hypothetical protein [Vitis varicosavirus]